MALSSAGSVPTVAPVSRRTFWRSLTVTLAVLALAAVYHWGIPAISAAVPYREVTASGQTFTLQGGLRITPPTGWGISHGTVTSQSTAGLPDTVTLFHGTTTITMTSAVWPGSARGLLDQIRRQDSLFGASAVVGQPKAIHSDSGVRGYLSEFRSGRVDGVLGAFVSHGSGLKIQAYDTSTNNPNDQMVDAVGRLLVSVQYANGKA